MIPSKKTIGSSLFKPTAGEWLIASTSQYFIALSGTLGSTGLPGAMLYIGLRTTNAWENQYDDNPPLASVCYDGSYYYQGAPGRNASMWARTFGPTGTVNSNPAWYRIANTGWGTISGGGPDSTNISVVKVPSSFKALLNLSSNDLKY